MQIRRIIESAFAAGEIAILLPFSVVLRRFYNRAGCSSAEVESAYPCDKLVPHPSQSYTRAITIDAPASHVWAYLVQLGQERAGLYSYDLLENMVGCEMPFVDHIVEAWQNLSVGDPVRFGPARKGYPTQKVVEIQPERVLVWQGVDAKTLMPAAELTAVIAYYLKPLSTGSTRLIIRSHLSHPASTAQTIIWRLTEVLNYVMEQKMMRSIKQYAERDARTARLYSAALI